MRIPGFREIGFTYTGDESPETVTFTFREITLRDEVRIKDESLDRRMQAGEWEAMMEVLLLLMTPSSKQRLDKIPVYEYDKKGVAKKTDLGPEEKLLYFCGGDPWQAVAAICRLRGLSEEETEQFISGNKASEENLGVEAQKKRLRTLLEVMRPASSEFMTRWQQDIP